MQKGKTVSNFGNEEPINVKTVSYKMVNLSIDFFNKE